MDLPNLFPVYGLKAWDAARGTFLTAGYSRPVGAKLPRSPCLS
jgi:hypothetical protein